MRYGRQVGRAVLRLSKNGAAAVSSVLVLSALLSGAIPRHRPSGAVAAANHEARADSAPAQPGPVVVGPLGTVAAGDTLTYTISWGAGARATFYDITRSVTLTNGLWSVVGDSQSGSPSRSTVAFGTLLLPTTFSYTRPILSHRMWLAAVPWDSATFTVSIVSRNSVGTSAPSSVTWTVRRKPGVPGPITVDSSLVVVGILLYPPAVSLAIRDPWEAWQTPVCAFAQFHDGAVANQTGDPCSRDPRWKLPSAAQQRHTDAMCFRWASSDLKAPVAAAAC